MFNDSKSKQTFIVLRGHRVILDENLAELYEVEVKVLNQAVKRNSERFPEDFMFQLKGLWGRCLTLLLWR
jgi:hypothetical protein